MLKLTILKMLDKLLGLGGLYQTNKTVHGIIISGIAFAILKLHIVSADNAAQWAEQIGNFLFVTGLAHDKIKREIDLLLGS